MHIAARRGLLDIAKFLLDKGAGISAQDEMGYTPLHLAAKQGNLDVVKYLVEKGADVDVYQGGWGYNTALHLAAANGHLDTVKYLIEKGANPKATDGDGKTPLQRANEKGLSDIVEYLAKKVQQVTEVPQVTEDYSNTSLHLAAEQGNLNAVKYFVEKGADINAKTNGDDTPLYKAAFVVEMQLARDKGFEKRAQAYAGKVYSRQSGRYTDLKKVFFIAISNCILFPKKSNYISSHTIRDEETNEHDLQCLSLKH